MAQLDDGFKWIHGYEGYYSINKDGEIASYFKKNGKKGWVLSEYPQSYLKPQVQNNTLVVNLNNGGGQKRFRVKKLVAEAFMGYNRDSKIEICHKDRDYHNCTTDNLFFSGSHSDVMKHYIHTPTRKKNHLKLQLQQIEKRQEKINKQREKLGNDLIELEKYFKRLG